MVKHHILRRPHVKQFAIYPEISTVQNLQVCNMCRDEFVSLDGVRPSLQELEVGRYELNSVS